MDPERREGRTVSLVEYARTHMTGYGTDSDLANAFLETLAALKKLVSDLDDGLLFDIVVGNARAAIRKAESKPRLRDEGSSREDSFFERFER
jgi:hypothetical protein